VNPGFDARNVLTLDMSLTGDRFLKTAGVEESAFTCCLPLNVGYGLPFNIVGTSAPLTRTTPCALTIWSCRLSVPTGAPPWLDAR